MQPLIDNFRAFNRRERFFVIGWALDNPFFTLGEEFREQVKTDIGMDIPADAFCAMDFPIDWIMGCLWLSKEEPPTYSVLETGEINMKGDDLDLVVAYEAAGKTQLLLIEAKGVTGWKNSQLESKAERLGELFGTGETPDIWPGVEPHFILASGKEPSSIDVGKWPLWTQSGQRPRWWLKLPIPDGLRKIVRCDHDGRKNAEGSFWKVV